MDHFRIRGRAVEVDVTILLGDEYKPELVCHVGKHRLRAAGATGFVAEDPPLDDDRWSAATLPRALTRPSGHTTVTESTLPCEPRRR